MMEKLRDRFYKETGKSPIVYNEQIECDLWSGEYVLWLENQLIKKIDRKRIEKSHRNIMGDDIIY